MCFFEFKTKIGAKCFLKIDVEIIEIGLVFLILQNLYLTFRGLAKWRLRKLLFDAKIQFLAKEKGEFTTKLAILANRC